MLRIKDLEYFEAILIWSIRNIKLGDKNKIYQVQRTFCTLFGQKDAPKAFNSICKILLKSKDKSNNMFDPCLNLEEEKFIKIIQSAKLSIEELKKFSLQLNLDSNDKEFLDAIILISKLLSKKHSCFSQKYSVLKLSKYEANNDDVNEQLFDVLLAIRVWVKAFLNDFDQFSAVFNFLKTKQLHSISLQLHELMESITFNATEPLEINCMSCKKISIDEQNVLASLKYGMKNDWYGVEKNISKLLNNTKSFEVVENIKLLSSEIMKTAKTVPLAVRKCHENETKYYFEKPDYSMNSSTKASNFINQQSKYLH